MSDENAQPLEDAPLEGEAISPELLRLIQRVAHREYLLDGTPAPRTRPTADSSSTRRRPAIGSVRRTSLRATRGTTARKVTWS
ncbi:hypothetical protein Acsp06_08180 [Actinomycetospora sp. NBRC 106375]|uniref:hypothetical protein n=1 Tax=Actinomycetospora sp. NBRC 106375 TaxID=3032207 RepID=UPI0024A484C9|nr:hypothetical protein [Actinomycetospora sp. NBRC 106375]GLZ44633.1 hypothetical protein Acsp06_08180 [Actinomycetospora sp. NBRC 106375]